MQLFEDIVEDLVFGSRSIDTLEYNEVTCRLFLQSSLEFAHHFVVFVGLAERLALRLSGFLICLFIQF